MDRVLTGMCEHAPLQDSEIKALRKAIISNKQFELDQ